MAGVRERTEGVRGKERENEREREGKRGGGGGGSVHAEGRKGKKYTK